MVGVATVMTQMVSTLIWLRNSLKNLAVYAIYHLIFSLSGAIDGGGRAPMNREMRGVKRPMLPNEYLIWVDILMNFDI